MRLGNCGNTRKRSVGLSRGGVKVIPVPGLGVYPGNACYDANRPSWLPYWFDDLTESDCKYPAGVLADLPQAEANITGVIGQTAGATVADVADAAAAGAASAGQGVVAGGLNNLTTGGGITLGVAALVGVVFLFLMVKK